MGKTTGYKSTAPQRVLWWREWELNPQAKQLRNLYLGVSYDVCEYQARQSIPDFAEI